MLTAPFKLPLALLSAIALLGVGVWWGGHPADLPTFLRNSLTNSSQTLALDDAVRLVERDYYRKLPPSQLVDTSIEGLVLGLNDPFSNYFPPQAYSHFDSISSQQFSGVGMDVVGVRQGLDVVDVFDDSPAARAGISFGDVIAAVNGRSLAGLSTTAASALIKGKSGTSVLLTVSHGGRRRTVRVARALVSPVVASRMIVLHGLRIAYVKLTSFSAGAHTQVRAAVDRLLAQHAVALAFDLRGNGGGLVEEAQLIASIFIPKGVIVSTRGRTQPSQTLYALGGAIPTAIPMAVLVDRGTASASEIVTGALQDHGRATVIGTHTYGKGVFQEIQPLPNGGALDITVGEYFTPNGHNLGGGGVTRGAGIAPNITVNATSDGLSDPALAVAERVLTAKLR